MAVMRKKLRWVCGPFNISILSPHQAGARLLLAVAWVVALPSDVSNRVISVGLASQAGLLVVLSLGGHRRDFDIRVQKPLVYIDPWCWKSKVFRQRTMERTAGSEEAHIINCAENCVSI